MIFPRLYGGGDRALMLAPTTAELIASLREKHQELLFTTGLAKLSHDYSYKWNSDLGMPEEVTACTYDVVIVPVDEPGLQDVANVLVKWENGWALGPPYFIVYRTSDGRSVPYSPEMPTKQLELMTQMADQVRKFGGHTIPYTRRDQSTGYMRTLGLETPEDFYD